ncbi:MAG: tRNA (adenosine(37)-N6)-threonylcarbamoyltransferase complex ATPase subunit type 1 TsaE [Oscillospiraceae bacterium]|nr:tRNA (adenosine(37)-N6)-threonylcarbamoyltransferase complex ATPase subunit type 1 TsaE [Oscillospiraceae bacterium]
MTVVTHSARETEELGKTLAKQLRPRTVLAFTGDLGAGKTTLTRGIAAGLGITVPVTSPTYTIVNEYHEGTPPLIHFDMYRLSSPDELFEIGWEDYLQQNAILAIEWSENIAAALPPDTVYIRIEQVGETSRKITITGLDCEGDL